MARKTEDPYEADKKQLREIGKKFGRAMYVTIMAARLGTGETEMDNTWESFMDELIEFAERD